MRVLAFLNQKGGVGKTTLAANVGAGLVRLGRSVLLVDLDPQGHLTRAFGADPGGPGLHEALSGSAPAADLLVQAEGALLLPASPELAGADTVFASLPGKERLLARVLERLPEADACILDCPPNLGLLAVNALAAAHAVVVPVQAEFLALAGLGAVMDTVDAARGFNPGLTVLGVALTRYVHRKRLCREVDTSVRRHFPALRLETRVRESVALAEAPGFGKSIFAYAPKSNGALDCLNLAREIAARGLS
ncbi:Sporulation initiation inhibitor protein Soj [Fundidesulfovibrio magnetotacticus]|uniref:Sporulation initiation inhibitor protein Soj n=1 Tax=Fundidesulfovibrio magnetotacticus TaxID=2730080 RepID=A0A6V8LVH3_9BACT|nr:ParA family protein [Fundidesulfovibrio magnetotacticus]GFK94099.1 Sporulation initiation inhibitor protein Soj [Fundidesulfovibrio magnetotacticus]